MARSSKFKIAVVAGLVLLALMFALPQRLMIPVTPQYSQSQTNTDISRAGKVVNGNDVKGVYIGGSVNYAPNSPNGVQLREDLKNGNNTLIHVFDIESGSKHNKTKPFACVPMKALVAKTPICIYNPQIDLTVSGSIQRWGIWEGDLVTLVLNFLKAYKNMEFLDLGCNVGIYTIPMTQLGRRVVSVDANVQNLRLISRSLVKGNLQNKSVTLLWNAISDEVETLQLKKTQEKIIGATQVVKKDAEATEDQTAQAITLDHLTPLFTGRELFIKMDIESYEWKALKNGTMFFNRVDVKYVLMECEHHINKETAKYIVNFFSNRLYNPYDPRQLPKALSVSTNNQWPIDVLWIKKGAKLHT